MSLVWKTRLRAMGAAFVTVLSLATFARAQSQPVAPSRDLTQKPPAGSSSISGFVVTGDAKPEPIRRARVTVRSDANATGWSDTTDDEGRFAIRGLAAGRYTVEAGKPAWLSAAYGATRPGRPGTPIVIGDAEQRDNVRLVMSRGAVVTGSVLDLHGAPLPGVTISVMRYQYSDLTGEKVLTRASGDSITDDQGVYRLFGLMPGDYVVVASLRSAPSQALTGLRRVAEQEVAQAIAAATRPGAPALSPPPNASSPELVGFAPIYFPGTADVTRATAVKLAPGVERGGLNITLDAVPTARIEAVPNLPDSANRQSLQVYLMAQQTLASGGGAMNVGQRSADGRVTFAGVTPGRYSLVARAAVTAATPAPVAGRGSGAALPPLTLYASADLAVEGRDLVVPLDLRSGMTVSGRVTFDPPERAPADASVRVNLMPAKSGPALGVPSASTDGNGAFQFVGAPPGIYRIDHSAIAALDAWRLTSATLRGREVLDALLEIRVGENVSDLVLHFTDRPSELSGKLQTEAGQPATGYSIVVFSASPEFWTPMSRRVRSLRPATDGGFSVRGLPAGEYYIAALTDIEPGEQNDPAVLATLVTTAAKVVVKDGARTVQDLMIK